MRLLLMNVIMYYAYAMVLMTLVFLLIIKRKIKKSLRRALIDSSLSVGASYFLFGSIHWLTYYKEAYSLYPFSIINISLTLLFVGSAITIGKKFVLPHPPAFGNSPPNVLIPDLADTENSIINLIQQGATNKDISEKLNLTLAKVKNINYKIFSRFGVNSRTELLLVLRNYTDPSAGPDKP
jgi:DNA-binding CsgD family transcriptional regulator